MNLIDDGCSDLICLLWSEDGVGRKIVEEEICVAGNDVQNAFFRFLKLLGVEKGECLLKELFSERLQSLEIGPRLLFGEEIGDQSNDLRYRIFCLPFAVIY